MNQKITLYRDLLASIIARVSTEQHKREHFENAELNLMYWNFGRMISALQAKGRLGAGIVRRLALDLKDELPNEKGFSERNINRMVQFWTAYPQLFAPETRASSQWETPSTPRQIGAPAVGQLPSMASTMLNDTSASSMFLQAVIQLSWEHNVILIQKLKHLPTRLWYARQSLEQGWSRETLAYNINHRAHEQATETRTSLATALPEVHGTVSYGLSRDSYDMFNLVTVEKHFHRRELRTSLVDQVAKFLIELGWGFAFVGPRYRLEVSNREFYLDMLFYHLHLRCFVVVDVKKGGFEPEYIDNMNFYCTAVDDQMRHPGDAPSVGLILCQTNDHVLGGYALKDIYKPNGLADHEFTRVVPAELASSLPSIEQVEAELSRYLRKEDCP
jgi:predicted nuclease of restriction endonuclease-like (RecB) superfamily